MNKIPFTILILFVGFFISCQSNNSNPNKITLFQLLPSSQTGIDFINKVEDNKDFNIFKYRNFYNGGGVAIGDLNNDGRPDIFFTSNMGENKLYFTKGDWKFEDVTNKAGIKSNHRWHTGVTMADVNGDGWLDIYVCNSGNIEGDDRANELYINQKDGTFKEEAKQYGLDDKGLGTQAVFFDYDHDGDLDCFVLNNSNRPIESFGYDRNQRNLRSLIGGHRLYRNDNGHFTDVSEQAGIYGSEIGFGLGVTVGDLNNDGWEDIYVSNDFFEKDYMYINQHNGTFKEVSDDALGHMSMASMGSDMADINNDGWLDIFTTEMLPEGDYCLKKMTKFEDYNVSNAKLKNDFHHQFGSNCLQLNNGDGSFSEIAQLSGVEATDWSWGALCFDFDNDGWKDIFVSNGIGKDLTDQDFLEYFSNQEVMASVRAAGKFDFKSMLDKIPSTPIPNYGFINQKNLRFKNESKTLGFDIPSYSNGAAYADLDGDGDLDLVVNNENMEAFVYRNMTSERKLAHYLKVKLIGTGMNTFAVGSRVTIYSNGQQQVLDAVPERGFESCVDPVLNFGLGNSTKVDSLIVRWPNLKIQVLKNIPADTTLVLLQKDATIPFVPYQIPTPLFYNNITSSIIKGNILHRENAFIDFDREKLIPKMLSTEGPKIAIGDVNGDGLEDFFVGAASGDTDKLFIQQPNGQFIQKQIPAFIQDRDYESTGAIFADIDHDGDADLIVVSGGNEQPLGSIYLIPRLYINDGKGNFSRSLNAGFSPVSINASCVRVNDYDGDGLPDIFIGARNIPGSYGMPASSVLLHNLGRGKFENVTSSIAPVLNNFGMVTDAQWVDIDGDGIKELVLVGDWMPISILKWQGNQLVKLKELPNSSGWWNCLAIADLNGDGYPDLVAGNFGLNSKIKADKDHPGRMFVSDFGHTGKTKCIPVYYKTDGKAYPFYLKGEMISEMPFLRKKFLHYSEYAGKTIDQVFSKEELKNALQLSVEQTETCAFINDGKGNFEMMPLPLMAQLSPVFAISINDINGDSFPDIFLAGNFYGLKPEVGRLDASYGTTLLGNKDHSFTYIKPSITGLFVKGEVRDVKAIKGRNANYIIIARNNDSLQIFRRR